MPDPLSIIVGLAVLAAYDLGRRLLAGRRKAEADQLAARLIALSERISACSIAIEALQAREDQSDALSERVKLQEDALKAVLAAWQAKVLELEKKVTSVVADAESKIAGTAAAVVRSQNKWGR